MQKRRTAAMMLGVALVASACQAGTDEASFEAGETPTPVPESADDDAREQGRGPLSLLMGGDIDHDGVEDEFRAWQRAVDDLTVACMADEGFTYHPPRRERTGSPASDLSPEEFAAQHGFGISTADARERPGADVDPNAEHLAEMSPAQLDAWNLALFGAIRDEDGTLDYGAGQPGRVGCIGAAADELALDEPLDQAAWQPLIEQINGVFEAVARDPRVVAAAEEWQACLSDAGHPGYSLDGQSGPTVDEAVYDRLGAVTPRAGSGEEAPSSPPAGAIDPGGVVGSAPGGDLSQLDPDELAEVQAFEIELAVADAACRASYELVEREVSFEHQEAFVDANRAELEAYRDALRASEDQR